jgi:threonine dehydrogenase-like Zn-dependent dehydrogenase
MRAAVLRDGRMIVDEVPDPVPQFGQVLVRTVACGICGSDLHFVKHGHKMIELSQDTGLPAQIDLGKDVFMGHEFCSEVLDFGPDTTGPKPGTLVVSIPAMLGMNGIQQLAYTNDFPAGYSERMLLSAPMLIEVPNGLEPAHAAMTEPMAVGIHAVNRSNVKQGEAALVLGCGPVGLAVIAALKIKGISPIVAADFSPRRRQLALTMGAHAAVDPNEEPAIEAWRRVDGSKVLVIYEAVGVPGMIHGAMRDAPAGSRILVVGVCMEGDTIQPIFGINKELNIQFVLGYDPMEFAGSLRSIAEGEIDVGPMITGHVDIEGVPGAFDDLAHPDAHAKIVVEPSV